MVIQGTQKPYGHPQKKHKGNGKDATAYVIQDCFNNLHPLSLLKFFKLLQVLSLLA